MGNEYATHQFGVVGLLSDFDATLVKAHTSLKLVVVDAIGSHDEEVVLLVTL